MTMHYFCCLFFTLEYCAKLSDKFHFCTLKFETAIILCVILQAYVYSR